MARTSNPRIVMVGTGLTDMGGIATVVRGYRDAGLFQSAPMCYVRSHSSGSLVAKICLAAAAYCRVAYLVATWHPTVFHIHVSSRASFWRKLPIFWLLKRLSLPTIFHLHGSEFMIFYRDECGPTRQRIIRNVMESVDVVLVLAPEWQDLIGEIAPRANIEVLTNGVRVPAEVPKRQRDQDMILFLGLLGHRKGIYDLLAVVDRLRHDYPRVRLIAAGDGEVDEVRAEVGRRGLADFVEVPGWIDGSEKEALIERASVFTLPSYNEGLPMSLLEAMAAGLPVVCSTVGGIPAAVTNGCEGLLLEAGDQAGLYKALESILTDREYSATLGHAAYRRVERDFNIERKVTYLLDLYRRLSHQNL